MKNCLILLTNYYPFHKGEEYLESEIEHLASKFHQIFVVSTMVSDDMKQTRALPDNVIVLPVGIKHSLLGKGNMVLRQCKEIYKDKEKMKKIKEDSKGNFLHTLYCIYFESRAMDVYDQVKEKLKGYNFDHYNSITIYSYWLYITARVAVELKSNYFRGRKLYTFSRAHGYDINEHVNPLKFLPERKLLLDSLDNVFPVSQNGVDFLNRKYPGYENKVEVRRLGSKKLNVKKQNNNEVLNIVSCSTVRKLKRIDLLIDALAILREKQINFKWTHIGGGPDFNQIKKMASQKLDDNQFEFTGHIKNSEVLDWYQKNNATVFANTSSSEGVPVSIMEAMSIALPVIATDVGGTREVVKKNQTGFILREDCTKEEIASAFIDITRMRQDEYQNMCLAAYDFWDNYCNAEKLYCDFANEISSERVKNG